jgi:hypothetical protein
MNNNFLLRSGSHVNFSGTVVLGKGLEKWYEPDTQIEFLDCLLLGMRLEASDLNQLAGSVSLGQSSKNLDKNSVRMVSLLNCRGIVFTDNSEDTLKSEMIKNYGKPLPNIRIVDIKSFERGLRKRRERNTAGYRSRNDKKETEEPTKKDEDLIFIKLIDTIENDIKQNQWESLISSGPLAQVIT